MKHELAQDVRFPQITVRIGGRSLVLTFNHEAMYLAECYCMDVMGRRINYLALLNMANSMMYAGMAALTYGAAAATMAMQPTAQSLDPFAFDRMVTMQELLNIREAVTRAAFDALPDVAGVETKNVQSRTASPNTRGAS